MRKILLSIISYLVLISLFGCSLAEENKEKPIVEEYLSAFKIVLDDQEKTEITITSGEIMHDGYAVDTGFNVTDRRFMINHFSININEVDEVKTKIKGFTGKLYFVKDSVKTIKIYGTKEDKGVLLKEIKMTNDSCKEVIRIKSGSVNYLEGTFEFYAVDPVNEVRYLYYDADDHLIARYSFTNSSEYEDYTYPKNVTVKYAVLEEVRGTDIERTLYTKQDYHVIAFKDDKGILGDKTVGADGYYDVFTVYIGKMD